jgi:hypothetical protein
MLSQLLVTTVMQWSGLLYALRATVQLARALQKPTPAESNLHLVLLVAFLVFRGWGFSGTIL